MSLHNSVFLVNNLDETIIRSTIVNMDTQGPFPLMRLPIELRLMVYERIPTRITRYDFDRLNNPRNPSAGSYSFSVIMKTIDLAILSTSQQIRAEATAIMHAKLIDIVETPPRLIVDLMSCSKIHKAGGPLWHISHYLAKRAVSARKHLGTVPYLGTGAGASGARYNPADDSDYPFMSHLMDRWFRTIDHQRASTPKNAEGRPAIELALTTPQDWSHVSIQYALRQLAYVLFAEHGGFQWTLRDVTHLYPKRSDDRRRVEQSGVRKVMGVGQAGDAVRAVPGRAIDGSEFEREWSDGSYLLI